MPSKKDPNILASGTGRAGKKSVGADALTFTPESGISPDEFLNSLVVSTIDSDTVNVTTVNADTIDTDHIEAQTGTFTTYVATNVIQPETGTSVSVDGDFSATNISTEGELGVLNIVRADGDSASDITIVANISLEDTQFGIYRDIDAGNITAIDGTISTDTLGATSQTEITLDNDLVGATGSDFEGYSFSKTAQRFRNLTEAFNILSEGEAGIVETYDATKELGDSNFELFETGEDWGQAGYDGHLIYTVNSEGEAQARSREDGTVVQTFTLQNSFVDGASLRASSNGDKVIFAYSHNAASDYGIEVYDIETGNFLFPLTTESEVFDIAMNHEAAFIIKSSGGANRHLVKYSLATGNLDWASDASSSQGFESVAVKSTTVIATSPTEMKIFSYEDGGSFTGTLSREYFLDYEGILDSFFDDSYFYLSLENSENRYETIVYEIPEVEQNTPGIYGDSSLQGMRKLWEKISDVPTQITSDHRNFYILEGVEVTSFNKKSFKKKESFEIDNTANLTINQFQADGQSLIVGGQYTVPSAGSFFLNLYLDLDPSLFLKVDPVSTRERIYYHRLIPFSEEKYREPTVRKFRNLTKAYDDMVIGETGLVETHQNEREFGYLKWRRNAAGSSSNPTNATASDGRYLYILSSAGVAKAIDRETGEDVHTYTFTNTFDDTASFHIATNGKYVAFSFNDIIEIFEVDSPDAPVIDFQDPLGLEMNSLWMNHDAVFRQQDGSVTNGVRKIPLDGSSASAEPAPGSLSVTGYGKYLIESFEDGSELGMRLRDAETLDLIGSEITVTERDSGITDLKTDGSYIYVAQDSSGIGGIAVYPLTRDGLENSFRAWSSITGEDNTRIAVDHRFIYIADDSLTLRVYDKETLELVNTIDISVEQPDATGIVGLIADGDSVFVSVSTAGNSFETTARYHMDQDPTLFMKVDPSHPRGKLFYHHLIPTENKVPTRFLNYEADSFTGTTATLNDLTVGSITSNVVTASNTPLAMVSFTIDLSLGTEHVTEVLNNNGFDISTTSTATQFGDNTWALDIPLNTNLIPQGIQDELNTNTGAVDNIHLQLNKRQVSADLVSCQVFTNLGNSLFESIRVTFAGLKTDGTTVTLGEPNNLVHQVDLAFYYQYIHVF